jgi:hypothetical protein
MQIGYEEWREPSKVSNVTDKEGNVADYPVEDLTISILTSTKTIKSMEKTIISPKSFHIFTNVLDPKNFEVDPHTDPTFFFNTDPPRIRIQI